MVRNNIASRPEHFAQVPGILERLSRAAAGGGAQCQRGILLNLIAYRVVAEARQGNAELSERAGRGGLIPKFCSVQAKKAKFIDQFVNAIHSAGIASLHQTRQDSAAWCAYTGYLALFSYTPRMPIRRACPALGAHSLSFLSVALRPHASPRFPDPCNRRTASTLPWAASSPHLCLPGRLQGDRLVSIIRR